MPELPDIAAYITALEARILGQPLERVRIASAFLLRTVDPPLSAVEGKTVRELRRIGKRIAIGVDSDLWLVLHLMIAGRFHWRPPQTKLAGRQGLLAALIFRTALSILTEAGSKRRASLHVLRGEEALGAIDPGGIEIFSDRPRRLSRRAHPRKPHPQARPHRSAPHQRHRQRLLRRDSARGPTLTHRPHPQAQARRMGAPLRRHALHAHSLDRPPRAEAEKSFPERVTAFRPEMAVHGRFGQPCPRCGQEVQRIRYADNETNYCARCQTGGKVLADRSLSRLLGSDWPRTLDELEALKRR